MFEFIRFVYRNPSYITTGVRRLYATRKAMNLFRARPENATCSYCGRSKRLEVHHLKPVSIAPEEAADEDNMSMLCRKPPCHQIIGHDGDFGRRYVENAKELSEMARVVKTLKAIEN